MLVYVLCTGHQLQIFDTVISANAVNVVHDFVRPKGAADVCFLNAAMLMSALYFSVAGGARRIALLVTFVERGAARLFGIAEQPSMVTVFERIRR